MKIRRRMDDLIEEMLDGKILLNEAISEFEKLYIEKCLQRNKNHISKTAHVLGIHRNTLSKRVTTYNQNSSKSKAKRGSA